MSALGCRRFLLCLMDNNELSTGVARAHRRSVVPAAAVAAGRTSASCLEGFPGRGRALIGLGSRGVVERPAVERRNDVGRIEANQTRQSRRVSPAANPP